MLILLLLKSSIFLYFCHFTVELNKQSNVRLIICVYCILDVKYTNFYIVNLRVCKTRVYSYIKMLIFSYISSIFFLSQFDAPHYYNSCTMKRCCFAGDRDQFVLSGSDDFTLYMWQIPQYLETGGKIYCNEASFTMLMKDIMYLISSSAENSFMTYLDLL